MGKKNQQIHPDIKLHREAGLIFVNHPDKLSSLHLPEIDDNHVLKEADKILQDTTTALADVQLNASLKEYTDLFNSSPVCYITLDRDTFIKKINKEACNQLKVDCSALAGMPFSHFLKNDQCKERLKEYCNSLIVSNQFCEFESEIQRKDGTVFFAIVKVGLVKDEDGRFKHFILILDDISSIKAHEKHVELALEKATQLNELKSRFITMASHEFRTPLTAILSSVWLVNKYAKDGKIEEVDCHLEHIRTSVKQLTFILDEFLSHEKLEAGAVEIVKEKINLPELCNGLLTNIKFSLNSGDYVDYKHQGENVIVSDKNALYHIITNLLSNAIKYSEEHIQIKFSTKISGNSIHICVADNGIGIPQKEQALIFKRFFRAQNGLSKQGTGLGLNIVQEYLNLLNGHITFKSKTGKGTSFFVEIPIS